VGAIRRHQFQDLFLRKPEAETPVHIVEGPGGGPPLRGLRGARPAGEAVPQPRLEIALAAEAVAQAFRDGRVAAANVLRLAVERVVEVEDDGPNCAIADSHDGVVLSAFAEGIADGPCAPKPEFRSTNDETMTKPE